MRLLESAAGAAGSPLRFEILSLLEEVFSTEGCPYLHEKRVVDFYIRFHYLAFVKLYVPYAPERGAHGDPRECTLHLKVLRAFAGNKNSLVKRRFHQLRIMDFLIREIDLEFEVRRRQHVLRCACCKPPCNRTRDWCGRRGMPDARWSKSVPFYLLETKVTPRCRCLYRSIDSLYPWYTSCKGGCVLLGLRC